MNAASPARRRVWPDPAGGQRHAEPPAGLLRRPAVYPCAPRYRTHDACGRAGRAGEAHPADIDLLLQPVAFDPRQATLTFTLAATDYALRAIAVPFIAALKVRAPAIRVRVIPVDSERMMNQLERGNVDVALITPHTTPDDLHSRALYDERYVCMMRADHPDAGKPLSGALLRP